MISATNDKNCKLTGNIWSPIWEFSLLNKAPVWSPSSFTHWMQKVTTKLSRNTYFKPEHATEVTRRARGLAGGGSPRWEEYIVSVLNETFNNTTRKYLKDATRAHNVPPWCVFMPQNEGCIWGWYPCLFLDQAVTIFRALGEKKTLTNAPQRNCTWSPWHARSRLLSNAVCVKDRDAWVWRHGTLLKRLIVISALFQKDAD